MPRTSIPVQEVPFGDGIAGVSWSPADTANGNKFPNDGRTVLLVRNVGASAATVTVVSVPDEYGRTRDIAKSVSAGGVAVIGPLRPGLFNQRSGEDQGAVQVNGAAGLEFAAVRLNP